MEGKRGGKTGKNKENTEENSGHYVNASSRPPERRPLERRMLGQYAQSWQAHHKDFLNFNFFKTP